MHSGEEYQPFAQEPADTAGQQEPASGMPRDETQAGAEESGLQSRRPGSDVTPEQIADPRVKQMFDELCDHSEEHRNPDYDIAYVCPGPTPFPCFCGDETMCELRFATLEEADASTLRHDKEMLNKPVKLLKPVWTATGQMDFTPAEMHNVQGGEPVVVRTYW